MSNKKKLIIFGLGQFAEIAFEYFSKDSEFEVVAFTVDESYLEQCEKFGLPVIPFEDIRSKFPPKDYWFFAALLYNNLNDLRVEKINVARNLGYRLASYISSKAFVWSNVRIGEHVFIFENNTVQPFVTIESNVILWSGNHIGHHSVIRENCFISSHVVISGTCEIGGNSFIGVNSTISNNIKIGRRSWLGPASLVTKSLPVGSLVSSLPSKVRELDEELLFQKLRSISIEANQSQENT